MHSLIQVLYEYMNYRSHCAGLIKAMTTINSIGQYAYLKYSYAANGEKAPVRSCKPFSRCLFPQEAKVIPKRPSTIYPRLIYEPDLRVSEQIVMFMQAR